MKKNYFLTLTAAVMLCVTGLYSCSKSDNNSNNNNNNNNGTGTADVSMRLTDGPGHYDALWLNIQQVQVTMEGQSNTTALTPIRPGMYNIMTFRNGLDTLLVRAALPAGKVNQIRLILGDGNYVVVDGVNQPLTTPSAQESGLKLNLNETFAAGGAYEIWIDFDASKSIHQTGNGKYMLKPVMRAYSAMTNGRIKGYVLPGAALTTVYVTNGVDTYSAIPAADGYFMIGGLPEGTYQVTLDAAATDFKDVTINNVQVKYGVITDVGTTTLVP
jgi:hypothetical protein